MYSETLKQQIASSYGTPAVVVDLDRVERNIARVQGLCDAAGVALRPHVKTHKVVEIARMQLAAGARGITCQKLGEAEVMAAAGIDDILISYNLLGAEKVGRLGRLLARAQVTVAADSAVTVEGLSAAAAIAGRPLGVVVECDTGRKRAGVETPAEAVELARLIAATPGLAFAGLLLYPLETPQSWAATQRFLDAASAALREGGLAAPVVSTGGTPNLAHLGQLLSATEHRAGTYVFNDRMMMASGAASLGDCALSVLSTVVSRAAPDRGILDAGSKTLTADPGGGLDGYGLLIEHPEARIKGFAEEHGFLDLAGCSARPGVGDLVSIVPNHVCVVVNMVDRLVAVRGGQLVGDLSVAARGRTA